MPWIFKLKMRETRSFYRAPNSQYGLAGCQCVSQTCEFWVSILFFVPLLSFSSSFRCNHIKLECWFYFCATIHAKFSRRKKYEENSNSMLFMHTNADHTTMPIDVSCTTAKPIFISIFLSNKKTFQLNFYSVFMWLHQLLTPVDTHCSYEDDDGNSEHLQHFAILWLAEDNILFFVTSFNSRKPHVCMPLDLN